MMKRNFTRFLAALALLVFLAPPMVGWGQTRGSVTYVFSDHYSSNTTLDGTAISLDDVITATFNKANGSTAPQYYTNGTAVRWYAKGTLVINASDATTTISSIVITYTQNNNSVSANVGSYSHPNGIGSGTWTGSASSVTFTQGGTSGHNRISTIAVTYTTSGGSTDPTISFDSQSANLGIKGVGEEFSTSFIVSQEYLDDDITLTLEGQGELGTTSIEQGADPTEVTWTYTPNEAININTTITATSEGAQPVTFTITGEAKAYHDVIIASIANGTVTANPTQAYEGQYVTLTVTPDQGYELEELTVVDGDDNEIEVDNLYRFQMPDSDVTVSATFVEAAPTTSVTDILNREFTGIAAGAGYSAWTDKEGISGAIYAGKTAGGSSTNNPSIQLRSSGSDCGIVTTTSGGFVTKVTVTWNSANSNGRALSVYGSNSAYSSAANLYNADSDGDYLGDITYSTNSAQCQTEYTISDNYAYIGLRSKNSAIYFDEIQITWSTEVPLVAKPTFSPEAGTYPSAQNVTISCETENTTIYYTTDGTEPTNESTQYTESISVTQTTTIKAIAYDNDNNASSVATATYTIVTPLTTIPQIFARATEVGSTQTDVYVTFDNWKVVGKSYSNAYVSDGRYGLNLYKSGGIDFAIGDQLSGTVATKVQLYTGGAELVGLTTSTPGLTVTPDQTFEPYEISLADLVGQGIYFGSYVDLGNLTYDGSKFTDGNDHEINPNNTFIIQNYPTLVEGKTYRVKGVFIRYNNTTERIAPIYASDFTEFSGSSIAITPAAANPFTYVFGAGPSEDQVFEVTGENLTSDDIVATITTGADCFEITDNTEYSSEVTVNSGDYISIRLKAGLELGSDYAGVLTLTSTGADDVVVNLTGSVTGATYAISLDDEITGGTIEADKTSAAEGETVTLTATPDAAYTFGSWTVYKDDMSTEVTVTDNQFTMPACEVYVTATFTLKDTYDITCVVTPEDAALMEASPAPAYEGQTVTLSYAVETGYSLTGIVITKTSDGSVTDITPTASGDNFTFTMPDYAVTATATFISDTYIGSFVKFTGNAIEEGDYLLVYDGYAMSNTVTSNKFDKTEVTASNDIITNPSRNIVWHISPSNTNGYWTIYNAKVNQYANYTGNSTNVSLVDTPYDGGKWSASATDNNSYDFSPKNNTSRYLRRTTNFGVYATGNGGPLTLYKYTVLTERTITFDGNGGTYNNENTYTQTVYDGIATNLDPNQFTYGSSVFMGWSTTEDGEVEYADGASITVTEDITLYAQWETGYTAMVDNQIDGGSVYIVTAAGNEEIIEAAAGTEITLTYTADLGYAFSAWNVYYTDEYEQFIPVEVVDNQFTMPAYDVIISAGFEEVTTYSLVTSVDQIVSGKHYIIVGKKDNVVKAMGYDKGNNRHAVLVTEANNQIAETEGVYEFVINGPVGIGENNYYTIYDTNEESTGYLYAPGGNNYLKTQSINDNKGQWTIDIAATTSVATIVANVSGRNKMQYNASSTIFSCYSTSQQDIYLYVKDDDNDSEYYGCEVSYDDLTIEATETVTIGNGAVMTVTGTLTNNGNASNLIIEDGGQLIQASENVMATVKKSIKGYGADNEENRAGYYLIASPVTESLSSQQMTAAGLTPYGTPTGTHYDLYAWDGTQTEEWRNWRSSNPRFPLQHYDGYLYANQDDVEITFTGTLEPYDNGGGEVHYNTGGFSAMSLWGNPFTCKAYLSTEVSDMAFFRMNADGDGFIPATGAINPMEGFFVQATNSVESQVFSITREQLVNSRSVNVNLSKDDALCDRAILRFDNGNILEKFQFNQNSTKLYIPQGSKDYAVVRSNAQGEMPVNFKAQSNGTYTISVNAENLEASYLHLIDNMTGNDIDLLATPSYTFEATTSDYASRFRLVFNVTGVEENTTNTEHFAFFNGSEWVISNPSTGSESATLQVIDMMGRVLRSEQINGNTTVNINEAAGIYMLRLVNGENVMVQKVVVR